MRVVERLYDKKLEVAMRDWALRKLYSECCSKLCSSSVLSRQAKIRSRSAPGRRDHQQSGEYPVRPELPHSR